MSKRTGGKPQVKIKKRIWRLRRRTRFPSQPAIFVTDWGTNVFLGSRTGIEVRW